LKNEAVGAGMRNIPAVSALLSQQPPVLLLDEVVSYELGILQAARRVAEDEFWCPAHFPGNPIMPGSLLIEMMAQAGGALLKLEREELAGPPEPGFLLVVERARFLRPVRPGDLLAVRASVIARFTSTATIATAVAVNDSPVAESRVMLRSRIPAPDINE
jgi:3-hydroxyacyl-[acyl-carrier-protein] dehydratase